MWIFSHFNSSNCCVVAYYKKKSFFFSIIKTTYTLFISTKQLRPEESELLCLFLHVHTFHASISTCERVCVSVCRIVCVLLLNIFKLHSAVSGPTVLLWPAAKWRSREELALLRLFTFSLFTDDYSVQQQVKFIFDCSVEMVEFSIQSTLAESSSNGTNYLAGGLEPFDEALQSSIFFFRWTFTMWEITFLPDQ